MDKKKFVTIFTSVVALLDSESEEETEALILDQLLKKKKRLRPSVKDYVSKIALMYNPDDFKSHFRLERDTFDYLLNVLAPHLKIKSKTGVGRPTETPEKQILVVLSMLSNQEVFRIISEKYDISKSTAWSYVHNICAILVNLSGNYIKWPVGAQAIQTIKKFQERHGFPGVLGSMDGSHIPITPPAKQQAAYCNRNRYHSIVLQAVCDANYMFTDVFAGYPGSVHDARVFRNSDLGKKIEDNPEQLFPHNSHILADSAYKNTWYVLTPFRDNGHLTRIQKQYNFKHSSTRVYIEQDFGLLKGRFRNLKHVNVYRTELIPPLIVACCVLHNICMQRGDLIEPDLSAEDENLETYYNGCDNTGLTKRNQIAQMLYTP